MMKKAPPADVFPLEEGMVSVRAGEAIVLSIGALDRQTGVAEIRALCRSRENRDLTTIGTWVPGRPDPPDHYYPVPVVIPDSSPTAIWELARILLRDGKGNCRTYVGGRDYDEFLFQVKGVEGIDSTPPRLLGIRVEPA